MTDRPPPRAAAGFTLLELIIVVLVFGIMSVMAYGGLNAVLKNREQLQLTLERTRAFQTTYIRLRSDFQNLQNRPIRDGFGDVQPSLVASEDGGVEFTHGGWRNPLYLPRSSMERVAYQLADGEFRRYSWRQLDRASDTEPVIVTMMDGVNDLKWRYLDASLTWQDAWPPLAMASASPDAVPPPIAVELTLETRDWGEIRLLFRPGLPLNPPQLDALSGTGIDEPTSPDGNEQDSTVPMDDDPISSLPLQSGAAA